MSTHFSPLRYPGGKNCIFPFVSDIFYKNQLLGINYAEPYAGGAGLALRLLLGGYVERIYINDLDRSIYAFWNAIVNDTDEFCQWINEVDISISNWKLYREMYHRANEISYIELAKAAFFLNRTNVSGILKGGGVIGGQLQKGKYKIDARFNKADLTRRIRVISQQKNRISISNLDGLNFINSINKKKEDIFVFLDPPYYNKGAELYMNFYTDNDHIKLSNKVDGLQKIWMISYDNQRFILDLYKKYSIVSYKLSQSASNRVGDEILIFPSSLNFTASFHTLNSPIIL